MLFAVFATPHFFIDTLLARYAMLREPFLFFSSTLSLLLRADALMIRQFRQIFFRHYLLPYADIRC